MVCFSFFPLVGRILPYPASILRSKKELENKKIFDDFLLIRTSYGGGNACH